MGESIALLTGLLWAIGVIFFKKSGEHVGAFQLNLFKNVLAFVCLCITAVILRENFFGSVPYEDFLTIFVSGMIGIGLSDMLFFKMLNTLGASRSALIDCLYSPFVIFGSFLAFGERLTPLQGVGGLFIISSMVLSSKKKFDYEIPRKTFLIGGLCGMLSMLFVAVAVLMVKPLLNVYPLVWLNTLRMSGGIIFLLILLPFHPKRKTMFKIFKPQRSWRVVVPGAFFGSYLSLLAWLAGFKYAKSGVVALLNQMSTVFIVILAAFILHEKMTRIKIIAVSLALVGVVLVIA